MKYLKHLLPDALAARLVFLLAIAIVVANVIALAVLGWRGPLSCHACCHTIGNDAGRAI